MVADAFAKHFNNKYNTATATNTGVPGIQSLFDSLPGDTTEDVNYLINVETIDKCVRKLSSGKACGPDDLSAEI